MDTYFAITQIDNINFKDSKSHITICETLEEAQNFPLTDLIVIKNKLGGRTNGSGFIYPNVFSYKVIDKDEKPVLLSRKNNKTTNFIFVTLRSDYADAQSLSEVPILDSNNVSRTIKINANHDNSAIFIINILEFLFLFENEYASNWNFYDRIKEKDEKLKTIEKENLELKQNLEEINLKLKMLRKRKINSKKN